MFLQIKELKNLNQKKEFFKDQELLSDSLYNYIVKYEPKTKENLNQINKLVKEIKRYSFKAGRLEEIINNLKILNEYNNSYHLDQKEKSIYEQETYNQFKKYYKEVRDIVLTLIDNFDYNEKKLLKYNEFIIKVKEFIMQVDFIKIINQKNITITSKMMEEEEKFMYLPDIIDNALKEDWDYSKFMQYINIYCSYQKLMKKTWNYHQDYLNKEEKELKENPADIILHNPLILKDNLFDKKTLLQAKKVLYKHASASKDYEEENEKLKIIEAINKTLKKY